MFALPFASLVAILALPFPQPAATAKPVACSIPRPCALLSNASSGAALQASSAGGFGILAESASGSYLAAAFDGESSNQSGNDAGATFGVGNDTGAIPAYGALGYGTQNGLYGEVDGSNASNAAGVYGYDSAGSGATNASAGVVGQSAEGTGVLGIGAGAPGLVGNALVGVHGVANSSGHVTYGIEGEATDTAIFGDNATANLQEYIGDSAGFHLFFYTGATTEFYVTSTGYEYIAGTLTTSKGTYVRERGASGVTRQSYGSRSTLPQIEDVGEAQMTNGRAVVPIDAAFADTIDMRRSYHVFVTPEGDCKGLYVTQKSASGFQVRELQGGRSSLAFDYRIVAKPLRSDETRLAVAPPLAVRRPDRVGSGQLRTAPFLTPQARLQSALGPQGYARAVLARRATMQH